MQGGEGDWRSAACDLLRPDVERTREYPEAVHSDPRRVRPMVPRGEDLRQEGMVDGGRGASVCSAKRGRARIELRHLDGVSHACCRYASMPAR